VIEKNVAKQLKIWAPAGVDQGFGEREVPGWHFSTNSWSVSKFFLQILKRASP
jgi:hypothetical protein